LELQAARYMAVAPARCLHMWAGGCGVNLLGEGLCGILQLKVQKEQGEGH
jgi:hypothetical protein